MLKVLIVCFMYNAVTNTVTILTQCFLCLHSLLVLCNTQLRGIARYMHHGGPKLGAGNELGSRDKPW